MLHRLSNVLAIVGGMSIYSYNRFYLATTSVGGKSGHGNASFRKGMVVIMLQQETERRYASLSPQICPPKR